LELATGYGLDGPGIESRWGARFSAPVQTGPGAHPASYTMGTGSFPGVKSDRGVTLTPNPLQVPWSRKSRVIPLLPLWAVRPVQSLSACTRAHFTFFILGYLCYLIVLRKFDIICFFFFFRKSLVLAVCALQRPCLIKSITNRCTWKFCKSVWSVLSQCLERKIRRIPACELNRHKHVTLIAVMGQLLALCYVIKIFIYIQYFKT